MDKPVVQGLRRPTGGDMLSLLALEIVQREVDSDLMNYQMNDRILRLLYSTEKFTEFRNHTEKIKILFPEYEASFNELLGCLNNKGVTNIEGWYSYNGYWMSNYTRNKNGILFKISERSNYPTPMFELNKDRFLQTISGQRRVIDPQV